MLQNNTVEKAVGSSKLYVLVVNQMTFIFENEDDFKKFHVNNTEVRYTLEYLEYHLGKLDVLKFLFKDGSKRYITAKNKDSYYELNDDEWIEHDGPYFLEQEYNLFKERNIPLMHDCYIEKKLQKVM